MFEDLVATGSYFGIIVFMLLTGLGMPLPEEVAIVGSGILAADGKMDPWLAVAANLVGALLGDGLVYMMGARYGRRLVLRQRWMTPERVARLERELTTHGFKVLFVARFLVGLRTPVYLAAGALHLPLRRFFLYDLVAATTVISTFFALSFFLSREYGDAVYAWIRHGEVLATVVVVVLIVIAIVIGRRRHLRRSASSHVDAVGTVDDDVAI